VQAYLDTAAGVLEFGGFYGYANYQTNQNSRVYGPKGIPEGMACCSIHCRYSCGVGPYGSQESYFRHFGKERTKIPDYHRTASAYRISVFAMLYTPKSQLQTVHA